jgi:hypothetical protein
LQAAAVAEHRPGVWIEHRFHANLLGLRRRPHSVDGRLYDLRHIEACSVQANLARDDATHIEQVFDDLSLGFGISLYDCETLLFLVLVFRAE